MVQVRRAALRIESFGRLGDQFRRHGWVWRTTNRRADESLQHAVGTLTLCSECLHYASMPNVLVRDLPADVHAELQRRAERRGQSLQQYLAGELGRLVARPELDEVLDRLDGRRGGRVGLAQAADDTAAERSRR